MNTFKTYKIIHTKTNTKDQNLMDEKKSNILSKNAKRLSNKQNHEQHHVLVYMRKKKLKRYR